ncbi:hypothetical protein BLNAU_3031 [Blattamonas nauphoetae]|uniref:Right handed beta helix domain-containing protein n=1 Tax=Blattamonas nauphoetae TaxID=2049346 RepID=A0ABQ9YDY0_9EUKA|nr:hypothetical protein BLNAU_3031 [Blattamonas nauphoetae]
MLGCVVSLTSSHLSGSTIRDMNTGGSVLCSNSSFSSLLSSPNNDPEPSEPTVSPAGDYTQDSVVDGTEYYFDSTSGIESSSTNFSNCRFTGDTFYQSARPLTFNNYPGAISIKSCSFTGITNTDDPGAAVHVYTEDSLSNPSITAKLSNFTSCSARGRGGAMYVSDVDGILIESCHFEECSAGFGGGIHLTGKKVELINSHVTDCTSSTAGAGMFGSAHLNMSIVDTRIENCKFIPEVGLQPGGGLYLASSGLVSVKGSQFIGCSSGGPGGAVVCSLENDLNISDTLVKDCHSGATGAIFIMQQGDCPSILFSHVLFDGNSIGDDISFLEVVLRFSENVTKFPDVAIMGNDNTVYPTLTFDDCFTTIASDSLWC